MTYHERELLVSKSPQKRIFNNSNKPTRLSQSQSFRVECKAEERHFPKTRQPYQINSILKPIRHTMDDQTQPIQFRSEIIVHTNPETDLHIKRLRVNFNYQDEPSNTYPSQRSHSLHMPRTSLTQQDHENSSRRRVRWNNVSSSQRLLHQWIDDICANQKLMSNDDIVFFIKNGEFFARI